MLYVQHHGIRRRHDGILQVNEIPTRFHVVHGIDDLELIGWDLPTSPVCVLIWEEESNLRIFFFFSQKGSYIDHSI